MKLPNFKFLSTLSLSLILSFVLLSSFLGQNIILAASQEKNSQVLGETVTLTETQKMLLLAKPAVVQITNTVTGEVIVQATVAAELGTPALTGKTYNFKISASGSGFFITPDGHLITNGHVAKPDKELVAYFAINQLTKTIYKDAVRILVETYYGYSPSDQDLEAALQAQLQQSYGGDIKNLANQFYQGYRAGELKVNNLKYTNYIQTGIALGSAKKVEELGKTARLIDTSYEGEFDSKDLALLKVEGSNFPTVKLGSFENINIGTEVYAIGYPGIVEELMGVLTDKESELEPSITKGIISAKKKLVDGTEAFQTDAAITHGNSGGPAINSNGEVVGVGTWSFGDLAGGESFNFLISVERVKELINKNSVTPTESLTNEAWKKGLELFSQKHYSAAQKEFESLKKLYPDNVDVETYISQAQAAIARGEDVPVFGLTHPYVIFGGGALLVVLTGGTIFIIWKKKKGPKEKVEPEGN